MSAGRDTINRCNTNKGYGLGNVKKIIFYRSDHGIGMAGKNKAAAIWWLLWLVQIFQI